MILSAEKQIYDTAQKPNRVTHETAVEALQDAATAQETADTAQTTAENAQATANDAVQAADAAELTATEALHKHGFCSCTTAAGTAAKTADLTGFQLKAGSTVHVTFTYANSVANPTLNINGTGAKPIRWNGANVTATVSPWAAGECVAFVYDGTNWVISGQSNISADNIVSGSITADRIKANVITAVNNGTGSISADKIKANVISAVNNGTGTINADKINVAGLTIGQSQVTGLTSALNGKETAGAAATALANAKTYADGVASDAATKATNYITNISGGGIAISGNNASSSVKITNKVRVEADSTHFTEVQSDGMRVYAGSSSVPVAKFLSNRIDLACDNDHYTEFTYQGFTVYGGEDVSFLSGLVGGSSASFYISNSYQDDVLVEMLGEKRTFGTQAEEYGSVRTYNTNGRIVAELTCSTSSSGLNGGGLKIYSAQNGHASSSLYTESSGLGHFEIYYGDNQKTIAVNLGSLIFYNTQQEVLVNNEPTLEFNDSSGNRRSWYSLNRAYIKDNFNSNSSKWSEGYVVHGQTPNHGITIDYTSSGKIEFYVDGNATAVASLTASDERMKTDIEPIDERFKRAVGSIVLKNFNFNFTDSTRAGANLIRRFGVIAQETIAALENEGLDYRDSELIDTMKDADGEYYMISYIPFLIARLAYDEDRINELTNRLETLERRPA